MLFNRIFLMLKMTFIFVLLCVCFGISEVTAKLGEPRTEPTFKVSASTTKPDLNEPVTIKTEYTADADMDEFIFYINLKQSPPSGFPIGSEAKVNLLEGEVEWTGSLKKGEIFHKEIKNSFPSKTVYLISVLVRRMPNDRGFDKGLVFYSGGAFK